MCKINASEIKCGVIAAQTVSLCGDVTSFALINCPSTFIFYFSMWNMTLILTASSHVIVSIPPCADNSFGMNGGIVHLLVIAAGGVILLDWAHLRVSITQPYSV